jgi:hypothetical protein
MRAPSAALSAALLGAALGALACPAPPSDDAPPKAAAPGIEAPFTDVTAASGIDFVHVNAATERRYLPETMGAGVAVFDYDGDDWPDLYFVNGAPAASAPASGAPSGVLYRNLHDGRFADVTVAAGLEGPFLGMGAAVGDLDSDGDVDLFVTGVGGDRLFRNNGGSFVEASAASGLVNHGFGSSAAFVDVDRDGWLDLFVGRYVEWSAATDRRCSPDGINASYCTPEVYPGASNRLYRNLGGARFTDVTREAGLYLTDAKTLGVVPLDHDGDGWPDLAVANDTTRNFLFRNLGDGRFEEVGVEQGIAYSSSGSTRGGMGIDAGDLDGDGDQEVVVGNFAQEMTAVYRASGDRGPFRDEAAQLGVGIPSLMTLAFGTLLFDYDADGWLDLLLVNGHIEPTIARFQPHQSHAQAAQLFRNTGTADGFTPVEPPGDLAQPLVGRGLASGDFDRDGDLDLVVTQNGGPARLFRNDSPPRSWLRLELVDHAGSRTPYGARVVVRAGDLTLERTLTSGRSYLSASEPVLVLGLGGARVIETLEVHWPSGAVEVERGVAVDRVLRLVEPDRPPTS